MSPTEIVFEFFQLHIAPQIGLFIIFAKVNVVNIGGD